jgi:two-component system, NtrC family, sensor kinase
MLGNARKRSEVSPTPDRTLADPQKVIANLRRQLAEAQRRLEEVQARETATAEVLQVINASPGDLAPVFDAMLEKAMRLCGAAFGQLGIYDGDVLSVGAVRGPPDIVSYMKNRGPVRPIKGHNSTIERLARGENVIHVADAKDDDAYREGNPNRRALVDLGGCRTLLNIALRKDRRLLGTIEVYRQEVHPFSNKQIALLQNFAAQAVIAMENARLITETREALDQQTATAEVLRVINSSPGDLVPVFDAMLEKALGLCEASLGMLYRFDGEAIHLLAVRGASEAALDLFRQPVLIEPESAVGGMVRGEAEVIHSPDVMDDEIYRSGVPSRLRLVELTGARTAVWVALRKDEALQGVFVIYRQEVRPFSDKQIALLQNFAAQAVIAMENARLITETREALDQQTATAEVLGVINASPGELTPVFGAMLEKALRLCEAAFGVLWALDSEKFHAAAMQGVPPAFADYITRGPVTVDPGNAHALIRPGGAMVHIADAMDTEPYRAGDPLRRALVDLGGARTALAVPLRRDDALLGMFMLYRKEVRPFADKQIALLQNFAAQAVIAMENARLITETREARDDAEAALGHLKAAQANLIQAEKMASLGQLTAGIAHEIKNPLNFVNNFASLSVELLDELKETTAPALATLDEAKRADADETIEMLSGNLEKIAEHGKRADNIVKSMLEHSRRVTGERRKIDLNGLIDEALNLAYHGARAQDQGFNITLEHDYAPALKPIELAPQEITRVFLNLFGNGFYAVHKRARENGEASFRPTLKVSTRDLGDAVEISVRDNGVGIAPELRDKLFQPFFTTKPTGEGTGLGLSISYDIVIQQHAGAIEVDSEIGEFTEFTVRLPRSLHRR